MPMRMSVNRRTLQVAVAWRRPRSQVPVASHRLHVGRRAPVVEQRLADRARPDRRPARTRSCARARGRRRGRSAGACARCRRSRRATAPIASASRTTDPAARRHPGGLEHVRARLVAARAGDADAVGPERGSRPRRGRAARRRCSARRSAAGTATRSVPSGATQRAGVAVRQERVLGDRGERRDARLYRGEGLCSSTGRPPGRRCRQAREQRYVRAHDHRDRHVASPELHRRRARRRRRGRHEPVLNPATGRGDRPGAAVRRQADVDRAVAAAARAPSTAGRATTPGERALALLRLADALEEHGDELAELEARQRRQADQGVQGRRDPVHGRQPALLRGRRAHAWRARPAGEYLEGYTSIIRREPVGVDRPDRAVELPADDGGLEDRPGAGHRQHDRAQAGPDDAGHRRCGSPRSPPSSCPRACSTSSRGNGDAGAGARRPTTTSTWSRSPARSRPASGSPSAPPRRSSACTSSSAARRRSSSSTTSTWRPRWRRSPAPATTTPARTAPRPRACSPAPRSTTTSSTAWPSRPRATSLGDTLAADTTLGPLNSAAPARARRGLPRAQARPRRGRHRRQRARPARLLPRADRRRRASSRTTR